MIVNLSADSLFDPTTLDFNEETFDDATLLREGFENVIDRYADTQVTHIFLNANYQRTCYQSKVWSSFWDIPEPDPKGSGWMLAWRAVRAGVDVFEICIQRCREKGISPWLSMRMNDWHNLHNPEIACPRWWEHPELRLSPKGTFDFAHSEVRDYHFELVVEFLQQYEIDGVELDWMRGPPFFKPDQAEAGCKWLTEFMRNVRQAADRCSDRLGRKLGIAVRVPGVPEHAAGFGLDAVTWAREGLVDILIPTAVWMPTDFDMPMEAWREQIGARDRPFRLAAGSDLWVRCTSNGAKMKSTPESLRGFSASMLSRGADAIYLFNHFNEPKDFRFFLQADDGNRTVERTHKELLSEGGEMETAMAGPRRHVLTLRNTVPPGIEFDEPLPRMVGGGLFRDLSYPYRTGRPRRQRRRTRRS